MAPLTFDVSTEPHALRSVLRAARHGLGLVVVAVLAACSQQKTGEPSSGQPARAEATTVIPRQVSLEINGFNYTDLYIDSFDVNGQGGGNLFVSTPTAGGGKGACCVSLDPGTRLPVALTIKWTRDGKRWCEKEVQLSGPIPANPRHLGVHFFPDGRIEAEITEDDPEVKLVLESFNLGQRKESGNTVTDEQTARCKDGY